MGVTINKYLTQLLMKDILEISRWKQLKKKCDIRQKGVTSPKISIY